VFFCSGKRTENWLAVTLGILTPAEERSSLLGGGVVQWQNE
jgi:hypothetical protein